MTLIIPSPVPLDPATSARMDETYNLLGVGGNVIDVSWVRYWLERGKSPLEIAQMARSPRRPDAHLGGTES